MSDRLKLCAGFLAMAWHPPLWGHRGAVEKDAAANYFGASDIGFGVA